jgi:hypothetical protein
MEVTLPTWRRVFEAAREATRLRAARGKGPTYEQIWRSLTDDPPAGELLDALEVIAELGTEAGRDLLRQAADDRRLSLGATDDEPARELAARVWVESRRRAPVAEVLVRARVNSHEAGHNRTYREFVGKSARALASLDRQHLLDAVVAWCREKQRSEAVEVYVYRRDAEWRSEILRGDPVKRVVEIRDGRPDILNFRPAAADHLRYETDTGRLGIATRSPRLLQMYREVVGLLVARDARFFASEAICTLRPLQEQGRALFERRPTPGVLRVDVVELCWRRGDRDKVWVRGRDCFQVLADLGARLGEGELIEAKLAMSFAGGGRLGFVSIKVPNRIEIKAGARERLVEQLLDEAGLRGAFGDAEAPRDVWSSFPWRMSEEGWRRRVGRDFDRLVRNKTLRPARLETVNHPDHPAALGTLTVRHLDASASVGVSDDPAVALRTLAPAELAGYDVDVERVAHEIGDVLGLGGAKGELASGLWALGHRAFAPAIALSVFLASRWPSRDVGAYLREASRGARVVLLVPSGCACDLDVAQVECRLPVGPYDFLLEAIIRKLGLQAEVPPPVWVRDDLILDERRKIAWFKQIELTRLRPDSQPFFFALEVARAAGRVVTKEALNASLSRARRDDDVAKKAKADFLAAVKLSFEAAGLECPPEANTIFASRGGGYVLVASARLLS